MLGSLVTSLAPRPAVAQSVSMLFGWHLHEDVAGDRTYSSYGVRLDHAFGRWIIAELGGSYVPLRLRRVAESGSERRWNAPRYAADAQLQAQVPLGRFRPYLGAGIGLFRYRERPDPGTEKRPTVRGTSRIATLGARLDLGRRLGVRGEIRVRADDPNQSYFNLHGEQWIGGYFRW